MTTRGNAPPGSIPHQLSRFVAQKIPSTHAIDWPELVAKLWVDKATSMRPIHAQLRTWISDQNRSKFANHGTLEWLILCVPGAPLVCKTLPNFPHGRKVHTELVELLLRIDEGLSMLDCDPRWLRGPIGDPSLHKQSGFGGTPLGIVAARMGRPTILVGKSISMSLEERRTLIASSYEMGQRQAALSLFKEAPHVDRGLLVEAVWRGVGHGADTSSLPEADPPPLWWDRVIRQAAGGKYSELISPLVQARPHLSGDLAAAMLRSGIEEVEALAHAQPGLSAAAQWPGRDGQMLPAMGVVVDTWVGLLGGKPPGAEQRNDLKAKIKIVADCVPEPIRAMRSARNWEAIGTVLSMDLDGYSSHERAAVPSDLERSLLDEWQSSVKNSIAPAWKRFAETAVFAMANACMSARLPFHLYLEHLLPLVRQLFLDTHGAAPDREARLRAVGVLDHLLSAAYRIDWPPAGGQKTALEWELWTLFCDRSAATSGWEKPKELTSAPTRTLRQIDRLLENSPPLRWGHQEASCFRNLMSKDEALPEWFQSFLQREVLRLSGNGGDGLPTGRGRTRL